MFKNYLIITWRNILRNKSVAFINVFGLALGMAAYWLILNYVTDELSYDEFHINKASLYRVNYQQYKASILEVDNAAAVPAAGPAMKDNFPQVVDYARLVTLNPISVAYQSQRYREEKIRVVDPSFLKLFTFPLLKGDVATVLAAPHTAVITEMMARKYFGNDDPVGKVITLDGKRNVEIRGVCRDVPAHSHIKFDFLISLQQFFGEKQEKEGWYWYDFYTYVQLAVGADPSVFQAEFNRWVSRTRSEELKQAGLRQEFKLQPVTDLHLYSHRMQELEPKEQGDGRAVYFLFLIGVFILTIAWANYINLTTARSVKRAKEVGVRKVMGAYGAQLQGQFLMESILFNIIAVAIAIGLIFETTPWLEQFTRHSLLKLKPFDGILWLGTILLGSLLSGFYPALVLSRLKPVTVLKGYARSITGGLRLRQGLVVFQFGVSSVLMVGTLIVYRQLTHLRTKDLGVKLEQMLIVSSPGVSGTDSVYAHTLHAFKTELLKLRAVRQITLSSSVPGQEIGWMNTITALSTNPSTMENTPSNKAIFIVGIDPEYVPSYEIKILAGRNFSEVLRLDQDALLLNNAATRLLGYASPQEAISQRVNFRGKDRSIIGILNDYNHVSPKMAVDPVVFTYQPTTKGYFSLKLNPANVQETIEQIKGVYLSFFPDNPLDYYFLDEAFNQQYQADLHFGQIFGAFAGLAILVACLGLFGLAAFAVEQRTKEIGIRKVLGATVSNIVLMVSKDFARPVLIALIVAAPIAYFVMCRWLENFAYRVAIGWWVFALSGGLALLIALLTVSTQAIKAALANPVEALRYE